MADKNSAVIGFEQQIWAAADILRGNMDAAEYKHVVLGLIRFAGAGGGNQAEIGGDWV